MECSVEKKQGCLFGMALGDALGAPYEGGVLERLLWRIIRRNSKGEIRYTDDTQMSLDLFESLDICKKFSANDAARRFASGYHWSRGYGPGTGKVLKKIKNGMSWEKARFSAFPKGSWGNGGAMRAPIIASYYYSDKTVERVVSLAREQAAVTHAHKDAQDGAALVAAVVFYAFKMYPGVDKINILNNAIDVVNLDDRWISRYQIAIEWLNLEFNKSPEAKKVAAHLGNGVAAIDSCVTAIYIALRYLDGEFSELLEFSRECGGDVDTICSMAGAIFGAANGYSAFKNFENIPLENRNKILLLSSYQEAPSYKSTS